MKKLMLIFMLGVSLPAFAATDLLTVYQQALQQDPTLQKADAERNANKENVPQSVAGLLPTLAGQAGTTNIRTSSAAPTIASAFVPTSNYNQNSYTLTLTQPLFNFQNWMQLRASKASAKQSDASYNAALQDLIIRTSSAYFNALKAQDNLHYIQAQKKSVGNQLKQIRERFRVGMATMTDVYQAQANFDSLKAQEIAAQDQIMNSFEALRQITGVDYSALAPLKEGLPLVHPVPDNAGIWVKTAEKNNWDLLAARFAEQSAKENIRVNYAGHFPTLNAVGQYQNGNPNAMGFSSPDGGRQWSRSAGLQLSVPIFSGGAVLSKTRQAQDLYIAASDDMEIAHRQTIFNTQQAFNNVTAGISKISADRLTVTSAKSALESIQAGYRVGTKTLLDVLQGEQVLYQAQATLSADQYDYVLNTFALKQAAGSLSAMDVINVNDHWLSHA